MLHNEGTFKTDYDLNLFEQWWRPETDFKAVIVIVHGYAEHSGRYFYTASHLIEHGYAVCAFDLRGHGRSEGVRAFVSSFDEYLTDFGLFLDRVKKREPDKPIFVLGHSLGGTIVTLFAITKQLKARGLILSAPLLDIPDNFFLIFLGFIFIIGRFFPKMRIVRKKINTLISRDADVVSRYSKDPLVYHKAMPAREALEINRAIKYINSQVGGITLPLLILHGTADKLADVKASKILYGRAISKDKTLKLYEGLYHEVLNEPEKERVLADLIEWLDKRA